MGVSAGPDVIENGLVLALDASDTNSYKTDNNLIPADTWAVSNFSAPSGWGNFGTTTENELIAAADPFGNTAVIWEGSCDATGSDGGDGGYYSSFIEIDKTKTYRVSAWVNRVGLGTDGRSYHGIDCRNVGAAQTHMIYRQSGTESLYPYFFTTSDPPPSDESELPENEWVLIVGHIWPEGSGTGSSKSDTGVYNTDGTKRTITTGQPPQDLVFKSTAHEIRIKNMLYYNATDPTVTARSVYPRIDLVDGTEPSISDLINNRVNSRYVYDICGQNNHGTLLNGVSHASANNGYFEFDGVNDYIQTDITTHYSNITLEAWARRPDINATYRSLIGKYRGDPAQTESYELLFNNSAGIRFHVTASPIDYNSAIVANTWYHVVGTYDGTTARIYLNGEAVASGSRTAGSNSVPFRIGASPRGANYNNGDIARAFIYSRALSASEIQQNYIALKGRFGL